MQERELEKRAAGAVRRKRMQDLLTVLLFMLLLPYTCSVVVRSGSGQAVETLSVGAEQEGILWEYGNGSRRLSEEEFLTGALAGCIPAQYREETLKAQAVILRSTLYAEGKKGNGSRRLSEEEFLTGALAGCIPAQYREETLKAQAVILRSTLYAEGKKGAGGAESKKNDTAGKLCVSAQESGLTWLSEEERRRLWGEDFEELEQKCRRAVESKKNDTAGKLCVSAQESGLTWLSEEERRRLWGEDFEELEQKCRRAVTDTRGIYVTQGGAAVSPPFFRLSAGNTRSSAEIFGQEQLSWCRSIPCSGDERAEDFWAETAVSPPFFRLSAGNTRSSAEIFGQEQLSWCRSIPCSGDERAEDFWAETAVSREGFARKLASEGMILPGKSAKIVLERDSAGYVLNVSCGDAVMEGERFRQLFGLASSCFSVREESGKIYLQTKGIGHGLGFDQYQADLLAGQGKTWKELLGTFFEGLDIVGK